MSDEHTDWARVDNLDAVTLDWRRRNEVNAAAAAQQLAGEMSAAGMTVTPGMLATIELQLLKMLNSDLEHTMSGVARRMAAEASTPDAVLH